MVLVSLPTFPLSLLGAEEQGLLTMLTLHSCKMLQGGKRHILQQTNIRILKNQIHLFDVFFHHPYLWRKFGVGYLSNHPKRLVYLNRKSHWCLVQIHPRSFKISPFNQTKVIFKKWVFLWSHHLKWEPYPMKVNNDLGISWHPFIRRAQWRLRITFVNATQYEGTFRNPWSTRCQLTKTNLLEQSKNRCQGGGGISSPCYSVCVIFCVLLTVP